MADESQEADVIESPVEEAPEERQRMLPDPRWKDLTWEERIGAIKIEWQAGRGSLRELGERYGVPHDTVLKRSMNGEWANGRAELGSRMESKVENVLVKRATAWVDKVLGTCDKLHSATEKTLDFLQPAADPDALSALSLTLQRLNATARLNFGLPDAPRQVDITSGGMPLQASIMATLKAVGALKSQGQLDTKTIDIDALSRVVIEDAEVVDAPASASAKAPEAPGT